MQIAQEPMQEKFPLGIIYQTQKAAYHERLPQIADQSLLKQNTNHSLDEIMQEFI